MLSANAVALAFITRLIIWSRGGNLGFSRGHTSITKVIENFMKINFYEVGLLCFRGNGFPLPTAISEFLFLYFSKSCLEDTEMQASNMLLTSVSIFG